MNPAVPNLVELFKASTKAAQQARARVAELVEETGKHQMEAQRHEALLKDLSPLLHKLEGGPEAINAAMAEIAAEKGVTVPAEADTPTRVTHTPHRPAELPPVRVKAKE